MHKPLLALLITFALHGCGSSSPPPETATPVAAPATNGAEIAPIAAEPADTGHVKVRRERAEGSALQAQAQALQNARSTQGNVDQQQKDRDEQLKQNEQ